MESSKQQRYRVCELFLAWSGKLPSPLEGLQIYVMQEDCQDSKKDRN